jgi:AcrR family transcriptional regulator
MDNINNTFASLLQDKRLSEITVSDICKVADINRSTFYEKYDDVSALADAYAKEIEIQIAEQPHTEGEFAWLFEYAKANADMFNLYFKLGISKGDGEYKTIFFKNGVYSVLKMWLDGGCVESVEQMNQIIKREYDKVFNS